MSLEEAKSRFTHMGKPDKPKPKRGRPRGSKNPRRLALVIALRSTVAVRCSC